MSCVLVAFLSPGPVEMLVVAAFALLLYGGDLPKVARSWGKSFTEFRRGFSGIQKDLDDAIYSEPQQLEFRPEQTSTRDDSADEPTLASAGDDNSDRDPDRDPAAADRG